MTWQCLPATEREGLAAVLDEQRAALVRKMTGVSDVDARRTPTASSLSLLSLLKHCTLWEARWVRGVVAGERMDDGWPQRQDEAADFALDDGDTLDLWVARYEEACDASRAVVASRSLDDLCGIPDVLSCDVRWVLLHLVEETARHAGHADLIREALDGSRGR